MVFETPWDRRQLAASAPRWSAAIEVVFQKDVDAENQGEAQAHVAQAVFTGEVDAAIAALVAISGASSNLNIVRAAAGAEDVQRSARTEEGQGEDYFVSVWNLTVG